MLMKQLTGGTVGGSGYNIPPKEMVMAIRVNTSGGFAAVATDETHETIDASAGWTGTYLKTVRAGYVIDIYANVSGNFMYKSGDTTMAVGQFNANDKIATLGIYSGYYVLNSNAYVAYLD